MRGCRKEVVRLYGGVKRFHGAEVTRSRDQGLSWGVSCHLCAVVVPPLPWPPVV